MVNFCTLEIVRETNEIKSLNGADQAYVNSIMANRESFWKLCNQYFSHKFVPRSLARAMKDAKGIFDAHSTQCKLHHIAVSEYNYTRVEIDHHRQGELSVNLKAQNFDVSRPWLDLLYAYNP